jgi:hypothetical protein
MEITIEILQRKFEEYNGVYFDYALPWPEFGLLKSYMTCGYFSCKKLVGKRRMRGQRIEVTCYFDWDEEELKNVILHEMIHYYLGYKHIDNSLSHGEEFMKMANEFNEKYNLKISVTTDCHNFRRAKNAPKLLWKLVKLVS